MGKVGFLVMKITENLVESEAVIRLAAPGLLLSYVSWMFPILKG